MLWGGSSCLIKNFVAALKYLIFSRKYLILKCLS